MVTLAGLAENSGFVLGTGSAARFFAPKGLAIVAGPTGMDHQLYVVDSANHSIRKIE